MIMTKRQIKASDLREIAPQMAELIVWLDNWWIDGNMAISPSTLYDDDMTIEAKVEQLSRHIQGK